MKFSGKLNPSAQERADYCDVLLTDPARLNALKRSRLMDSPKELAFDRLAHLAAKILKVPLTIVSLVSDKKQFFKAAHGLPSPLNVTREIPIDGSICRYTLKGEPIISDDASLDPLLKYHPATGPWGIGAFIAIPMTTPEGHVLGAFCAVDYQARHWSDEDIYLMQELTASVMTEIQLRIEINDLTSEKDLRERFVMALTHDLRTPLTSSKLSAQIMAKGNYDLPKMQEMAKKISANIDRADRMIQDLLDSNKIKAGISIPLNLSLFDICNLSKIIISDLSLVHGERFQLQSPEELLVNWDQSAVRRMIENLINNAIKYGSNTTPITLRIILDQDNIELQVHNLGNPILNTDLANIFEPYHRTTSATQSDQKGWGIGLTLVRYIAEAHNGKVKVTSSVENGTTFSVILPLGNK